MNKGERLILKRLKTIEDLLHQLVKKQTAFEQDLFRMGEIFAWEQALHRKIVERTLPPYIPKDLQDWLDGKWVPSVWIQRHRLPPKTLVVKPEPKSQEPVIVEPATTTTTVRKVFLMDGDAEPESALSFEEWSARAEK